jgi:hypothetical protein
MAAVMLAGNKTAAQGFMHAFLVNYKRQPPGGQAVRQIGPRFIPAV